MSSRRRPHAIDIWPLTSLMLLAWLAGGAGAQALECPRARPPMIEVILDSDPPRIDRSKSVADLSRLKQPGPRHEAHGLYTVTLSTQLEIGFDTMTDRRQACVAVDYIRARLTLQRRTIHIAREHPPETCEAKAILDHERKHQATDENLLAQEVPWLKTVLSEASRSAPLGPIAADQITPTQPRLKQELSEALRHASEEVDARRQAAQAQVDSPSEYTRVRALCPGGWR